MADGGKEFPTQSRSKYQHLFYEGIDEAMKSGSQQPKTEERAIEPSTSKDGGRPADPWATEDLWGDDLPVDVVEQCILEATQTVQEEPKTSERMMALQKSASTRVDKHLAKISAASGPLPPLRAPANVQPFRKTDQRPDFASSQASTSGSLMGRVHQVLKQPPVKQRAPSESPSPPSVASQRLTSSQRKLAAPTKSLPSSSASLATTEWLRSQLDKSSTECEALKQQIQSKEGESKVLRDKLQSAEREILRQKQEKNKELEKVKKQTEDRIKELEKKLTVAETEIMFKSKQAEANMDTYFPEERFKPQLQRHTTHNEPSSSKARKEEESSARDPLADTEIYEVSTQCSTGDEADKMEVADFESKKLIGGTFADVQSSIVEDQLKKSFLFDSDSDEYDEKPLFDDQSLETDSDDAYFNLDEDMGLLLADEISPELYVPSKVELNFVIAPSVDYDPHRLLYMDFSELIYDEFSSDPSKRVNIWDENPRYSDNPAIQPHYLKEPKKLVARNSENNTNLMEDILDKEMTQLDFEVNQSDREYFMPKVAANDGSDISHQVEANKNPKIKDQIIPENANCTDGKLDKEQSHRTGSNEKKPSSEWTKSRYFTTLEGIHVPLLKLSKAKVWHNENLPDMQKIVDHIKIMGRELFYTLCDPKHVSYINQKTLEAREKEIASYFNKETHEVNLFSHKPLSDKEKYVDFRRGIALLAVLCNISNIFGKLLVQHKLPPTGSEPDDLESWKDNDVRPAKRVDKYMKILYDNSNSEYKTKEIDGRINVIQLGDSEMHKVQKELNKPSTKHNSEDAEMEFTDCENYPGVLQNEVDSVIQEFEKLYQNPSSNLGEAVDPNDFDCDKDNQNDFNLWEYIQNPDEGLKYFSDPNGPVLELIDVCKELENEFNTEGKVLPTKKDTCEGDKSAVISFNLPTKDNEMQTLATEQIPVQSQPGSSKSVIEEITEETLDLWEKSHKCEADSRFNDDVLPFLQPELCIGDQVTEAEKSIAGMVLGHHKSIRDKIMGVVGDIKQQFGDYFESTDSSEFQCLPEDDIDINMVSEDTENKEDTIEAVVEPAKDSSKMEHQKHKEDNSRPRESSDSRFPSVAQKSKRAVTDLDEEFSCVQTPKGKGKMSSKFIKKSSKKMKLEESKSSSSAQISTRSKEIMSMLDPQPSTSSAWNEELCEPPVDDIPETMAEEAMASFIKPAKLSAPNYPSMATKKLNMAHSSRAFLARKRAYENLSQMDEEVEKEIDQLFESKENVEISSSCEEKKKEKVPLLDCPKTKIDIFEEYRKFQSKQSTLELLDYIYEIVCSVGNLRLTLNFNPLFSSIVELIRALFSNYVERFHTDIIDFLMMILREILYCFPSPAVVLQIQLTLVTAIKFERVVHQLCHNPSLKMSYTERHNIWFYKGVCFIQIFCFLMTNLRPHKVKKYWDIAYYMVRWIYGMYTLHFHIVDAKWYRKYINDGDDKCKCISAFHILLFKILSKSSFYYNLYSDNKKDMDDLTKKNIEEMMLIGVNLADIIVTNDPHFASHMKKRYQEYSGFLKMLMLMHNDEITPFRLPPFELAKVQLLLKEEEVIEKLELDSTRSYSTRECNDEKFFTSQIQEIIFFSEVEEMNVFNDEKFRECLKKPFDAS